MPRYIDADKIHQFAEENLEKPLPLEWFWALKIIDNAPTEEIAAVKHGKWEINCDGYYPYCTNCLAEPRSGVMSPFCPICGAAMTKGENV